MCVRRNSLMSATWVAQLEGRVAALETELRVEKEGRELAVNAAKLEVQERVATAMLARYQQGLKDGASLASGKAMFSGSPGMFEGSPATGSSGSPMPW